MASSLNLKIRSFRREDLKQVCMVEKACFKDPYPSNLLLLLARLNPAYFLVAEASNRVIGYVSAITEGRDVAHLVSIAVHPEARRHGVAKKLLEELIDRLRKAGFKRLILEVRVGNKPAIALYRALGFRETGRLEKYYEDGENALTMTLNL